MMLQISLDAGRVGSIELAGHVPREEHLDLLALGKLFVDPAHGHPLSIPAAASSSESFFRA